METLTLKDISGYLPFGLACNYDTRIDKNIYFGHNCFITGADYQGVKLEMPLEWLVYKYIKPIFFPISCLTKEMTHKGETFTPYVELMKLFSPHKAYLSYDIHGENIGVTDIKGLNLRHICEGIFVLQKGNEQFGFNSIKLFQKLYEWKIDLTGLIERGLAVDATTIESNPYS